MFIQDTPPKFICDHCGSSIRDDNVTMFYRGKHFHPECFVHGVEKMKTAPPVYTPRELKPVDLSRNEYGFPKT